MTRTTTPAIRASVPVEVLEQRKRAIYGMVKAITKLAQFNHYNLPTEASLAYEQELIDLPLEGDMLWAAVRSLLAEDSYRFPTAQAIRRRVLEEAGLLALPVGEAMALIREAACTPGYDVKSLPGPAQQAVRGHGGLSAIATSENPTAIYAQVRDSYEALARKHDRFILEPGGLHRFVEVAAWFDAVEQQVQQRLVAMSAAIELELDYIPYHPADCQAVLSQYRAAFGDALPRPYGAPEPEAALTDGSTYREGARQAREAMNRARLQQQIDQLANAKAL